MAVPEHVKRFKSICKSVIRNGKYKTCKWSRVAEGMFTDAKNEPVAYLYFDGSASVWIKRESKYAPTTLDNLKAVLTDLYGCIEYPSHAPNMKNTLHVLKAYQYYSRMMTHCCFDEVTAKYIRDNWAKDFTVIEAFTPNFM